MITFWISFSFFSEEKQIFGNNLYRINQLGLSNENGVPHLLIDLVEELMRRLYCDSLKMEAFAQPETALVMNYMTRLNYGLWIDLTALTDLEIVTLLKSFFYYSWDSLLPSDGDRCNDMTGDLTFDQILFVFTAVPSVHRFTMVYLLKFLHEYMETWNLKHADDPLIPEQLAASITPSLVFCATLDFPLKLVAEMIESAKHIDVKLQSTEILISQQAASNPPIVPRISNINLFVGLERCLHPHLNMAMIW